MRRILFLTGVLAIAMAALGFRAADKELPTFSELLSQISARYPEVDQLSADDFVAIAPHNVVVLDVRRRSEWQVSHLEGAIHVPPGISANALLKRLGPGVEDKVIVFYCSVGERSSKLADRSASALTEAGASAVYNLDGGIFGWYNDGRPVYRDGKVTQDIHPYNKFWGALIIDPEHKTYRVK